MAEILAFPAAARVGLHRSIADTMLSRTPSAAENYLASRLRANAEALARRGISAETIETECKSLEASVRREIWSRILGQGGRA